MCNVYYPRAKPAEVQHEYGIVSFSEVPDLTPPQLIPTKTGGACPTTGGSWGAVILAVAHDEFKALYLAACKQRNCVLFDVKGILDQGLTDGRL